MLSYHEVAGTNIVELTVDGKIDRASLDRVISQIDASIQRHGQLRVLEEVRSFRGMSPSAWWTDVKWGFGHMRCFTRAAVVSDKRWVRAWVSVARRLFKPFIRAEMRCFPASQLEAARQWLGEEPAGAGR
jgi:hypothetical protein